MSKAVKQETIVEVVENEGLIAPKDERTKVSSRRARTSGWRGGIIFGAVCIAVVLTINAAVLIYVKINFESQDGVSVLYNGECSIIDEFKVGIHVLINVLATVLLSISNYAMQVLSAPTRYEVDHAHKKKNWLDIGLPSLRNLPFIARKRVLIWAGLILSSLPLHLIYNSVVFTSFTAYEYRVLLAAPEFLENATAIEWQGLNGLDLSRVGLSELTAEDIGDVAAHLSSFVRLEKEECISTYGKPFMTTHSDVVVITTVHANPDSLFVALGDGNLFRNLGSVASWMCLLNKACDSSHPDKLPKAATWTVWEKPVDYCLSRTVIPRCKLNFSTTLMAAVVAANAIKLFLLLTALSSVHLNSIVTVGDAVSSFMSNPDETTKDNCLMGKEQFELWKDPRRFNMNPIRHRPHQMFWIRTIGPSRLLLSLFAIALGITASLLMLQRAIQGLELGVLSLHTIYALGFGRAESQAYWDGGPTTLLSNVLVTNLPQLIFSVLYLVYSGLYTGMLTAREWSTYSHKRSPLRVTKPKGEQQSTFFLQVPYKYGVPIMAVSATLHWVISQSFFVMAVDFIGIKGHFTETTIVAGYSILAIIVAVAISGFLVLVFLVIGFRRLSGNIPYAGACSAAISAACHSPEGFSDPTKAVMWGVVEQSDGHVRSHGHCSFSSGSVSRPVSGELYAGKDL